MDKRLDFFGGDIRRCLRDQGAGHDIVLYSKQGLMYNFRLNIQCRYFSLAPEFDIWSAQLSYLCQIRFPSWIPDYSCDHRSDRQDDDIFFDDAVATTTSCVCRIPLVARFMLGLCVVDE
jgi:hypothetical protein